jgi:DNA topoisomerase-1
VNNFKNILDFNFTARVEKDFDSIANGSKNWTKMLDQFYSTFQPNVDDVKENAARETGERFLGNHPESGKKVIVLLGKFD